MSEPIQAPSIPLDACIQIVETTTNVCKKVPVAETAINAGEPNWDAMANSFASLSLAFTVGSIILGVVAVLSALGWGYLVKIRAESEARNAAEDVAKRLIDKWLAEEAPGLIRRQVDLLQDASIGRTDDDAAADEMGEAAG